MASPAKPAKTHGHKGHDHDGHDHHDHDGHKHEAKPGLFSRIFGKR